MIYSKFWLMTIGRLNPDFISFQEFKEVGVTNQALIHRKISIINETPKEKKKWIKEIISNINDPKNKLKPPLKKIITIILYQNPKKRKTFVKKRTTFFFKDLDVSIINKRI
jgi:hypothetical protein